MMTTAPQVGQRVPYLYVPQWIGQAGSPFIQVAQMRQNGSARVMSVARDPLLVLPLSVEAPLQNRVGDVLRPAEHAASRVHDIVGDKDHHAERFASSSWNAIMSENPFTSSAHVVPLSSSTRLSGDAFVTNAIAAVENS